MHFHPPQRLPFCPHRPHTRCHVYPGLLWLSQMLRARHLIQFRPSHPPHYLRSSSTGRRNHSYTIKQSKTDQTKKGHFIYIFKLQSPLSPYQTLLAFLHLRKSQSKLPSDPLFTDDSNRPATRFWFQKHLKAVLHLSGTPAGNFSSHSFRIGAATTAAHKGLSQQQIQELGRWSSEAFKSYIRLNRSHIKEAHQTLIGHPL